MKPRIAFTVDFIDMPEYNEVPLDESWYEWVFDNCARHGVKRVYWRVSLGRAYYRSRVVAPVSRQGNTEEHVLLLADMLAGNGPTPHDPLQRAVKFAHKHGVELYGWFPFSETHPLWKHRDMVDPWYAQRRHLFWCNRDGSRAWLGLPCVAEPEVVQRTSAIIEELCAYGVDGILLSPRSHCYAPGSNDRARSPVSEDEFGFNEPVRQRFEQRHGTDICRQEFDAREWHRAKGEFYTEFLASSAATAHRFGVKILAGCTPRRLGYLPNLADEEPADRALRVYNDWTAWASSAKVDGICAIQPRLRLADWDFMRTTKNARDIGELGAAAAEANCPVHVFSPVMAYCNKTGKSWNYGNFRPEPIDQLQQKFDDYAAKGAVEIILQEAYMMLCVNTLGQEFASLGALPRMDFWHQVKLWNAESR